MERENNDTVWQFRYSTIYKHVTTAHSISYLIHIYYRIFKARS